MSAPADLATAAQAYVAAILAAIPDPADAIDILAQLATFPTPPLVTAAGSAIGHAQQAVNAAAADLFRRAAAVALAQASSVYQPSSYDDAQALRTTVCGLLDDEITIAGDQGQDQSFLALKALRAAVARDLTARGAALAPLVTVNLKASLPALAVAYRLYRDIARTDQVIAAANAPHPAFLPPSFRALAS